VSPSPVLEGVKAEGFNPWPDSGFLSMTPDFMDSNGSRWGVKGGATMVLGSLRIHWMICCQEGRLGSIFRAICMDAEVVAMGCSAKASVPVSAFFMSSPLCLQPTPRVVKQPRAKEINIPKKIAFLGWVASASRSFFVKWSGFTFSAAETRVNLFRAALAPPLIG
jgi:hypothetical protein